MIILTLWQWWYSAGWLAAAKELIKLLKTTAHNFSVPVLLKTLLAPWKRTVDLAGPNTPIQVRLQWWVGNQVSRLIGLVVRVVVLLTAALVLTLIALGGGLLMIAWPLIPPVFLISLVLGVWRLWT